VYLERRHVGAVGAEWDFSFLDRVLIAGRAICFYVRNLLFPTNLTFIYPRWSIDAHQWWQYLFPCGVLLALAALWLTRHRIGRGPVVGALFFAGTLFPALGFVNVYPMRYSFVADHFQYLASIGVIALLATCAVTAFQRVNARFAGAIAAAVVLTMLIAATFVRARVYHDEETLWRDTLARNPNAWMAANNLAIILDDRGEPREALDYYRRALELHPDWEAHFNMASSLARNGDLDQARRHFESAVAAAGDNPAALDDLARQALGIGNKLSGAGQLRQAEALYEQSLHLRPDQLESMNNLAWVLSVQGDVTPRGKARAIELAEKAIEQTRKQQAAIIDTLAAAYANAGRYAEAVRTAELAVSLATKNGSTALSEVLRDHLRSFQAGRPLRESRVVFEQVELGVIRPQP
jgi:tetratricopeptide (TPR) repeat protein